MSVTLQVNGSERDVLRLFHIDLPKEDVSRFADEADDNWPLRTALGAETLRPLFTEVVALKDLGDMPLSSYLSEAHGVIWDSGYDKAAVDALEGHVLILPSQAFANASQTFTVQPPLRWIGTYGEIIPAPALGTLDSAAARRRHGSGAKPVLSLKGRRRKAIAVLLVVLVLGLLALLV